MLFLLIPCVLAKQFLSFQVSALDPDCGVNSIINYTIGDQPGKYLPFEIKAATGELCVARSLDYEQQSSYEFPIIATDRGRATDNN